MERQTWRQRQTDSDRQTERGEEGRGVLDPRSGWCHLSLQNPCMILTASLSVTGEFDTCHSCITVHYYIYVLNNV